MNRSLLVTPLLAVFFAVVTCFVWDGFRVERAPERADTSADLARVESRLAGLESRLEATVASAAADAAARAIGEWSASHDRRAGGARTPGDVAAAAGAVTGDTDGADGADGAATTSAGARLAGLLGAGSGGEEELRGWVAQVIEDERQSRDERRQSERRERAREFEAMREGPYGERNFRVNSMAKKLGLDDAQKDFYHELLTRYGDEHNALRQRPDGDASGSAPATPEELARHLENVRAQEAALAARFDAEFARGLTPAQNDLYRDLPAHERGPRGGEFQIAFSTGGDVLTETLLGASGGSVVQLRSIVTPDAPAPPAPAPEATEER